MKQRPLPSLATTRVTVLLLAALSGCDPGSMTKTVNFGQGNVIHSSGSKTTVTLEGVTLEILHPGVADVSAKTFTLSSVPKGPEIKVYEIQLGTQIIQLWGGNNALSLTVNQQAQGSIQSGSTLEIDQNGTLKVIKAGADQAVPDQAPR